ncbi:MAG TPA: MerR family transcriptional regulator [Euzebyales bacterium]|nr:MerR family transcriptional regulator [Euzebyales bacterium]
MTATRDAGGRLSSQPSSLAELLDHRRVALAPTSLHAHQLRYYEAQGLLEPGRGANGYREYTSDAIVTVKQIRKLLDAGLST